MTAILPESPFGYTIFCDDFRKEDSGKLIFIGTYVNDMSIVGQFPAILPTFCMFVRYCERPTDSNDPVNIKVFVPKKSEAIVDIPINIESLRGMTITESTDPDADPLLVGYFPIKLTQFAIEAEGHIKVRAYKGDQEIRLGALAVRSIPLPPELQLGLQT